MGPGGILGAHLHFVRTSIRGLRRLIREVIEDREKSRVGKKGTNVWTTAGSELAKQFEPDIFDMVVQTYAKMGGNLKIKKPEDVSSEYSDWIVADIDDDSDPDIFVGGNPRRGGMKLGVTATDGSAAAKSYMQNLKKQLFNNGWWVEVSDAPAHIALNKLGIKPIEDEQKVRQLLDDKKITWYGDHPEGKFPGTQIIVGDI